MAHLLTIALSFPCVVYTVLLGASLVYWVFVMVGAARIELLGDGAADGVIDGLDGAGVEGHGAHDFGDAGGDGHGAHDGHDVGDGDADGLHGDGHHGALAGMMAALKLRSAPATVVLSLLVLFSWLFSALAMQAAEKAISPDSLGFVRMAVFLFAPIVALPFTSLAIRPLARVFAPPKVAARQDLVGKVCTIRTGTVTDRFGEAMLEDGGAGLVVRVRVDTGEKLARGDHAVIVGYDEEAQEFTVARMDDDLAPAPKRLRS
ncbi:hypothetical protein AKJ09_05558 [Labilithrix luteola]|uniref:DUF1449 family protein n=1 Tax=Labilithrix luteola TaxID=1391654 RepID=A0A0K1Q0F4_9BACT|nr:OB-fold-containig protein [Labilithrix luteola]AKU98894.1 hypothetical protein AKJ09_05558 [Labilithrix luteola]